MRPTWRNPLFLVLVISHICGHVKSHALSVRASHDMVVVFANRASTLGAEERGKLAKALDVIREEWCGFTVVIAVGHAERFEGSPRAVMKLSHLRAQYVADLLRSYGVPLNRVYSDGKGATQAIAGQQNTKVEITFVGEGTSKPCDIPVGPGGFRSR
jgi:outer membrane protein OmpA-like peptidoglycan-associated protein